MFYLKSDVFRSIYLRSTNELLAANKHRKSYSLLLPSYIKVSFFHASSLSKTRAMNFCFKDNLTQASYFAKNQTEQNCGCVSCIRRCCKPGFIYRAKFCYGNSNDKLNVSVYKNKTNLVKVLDDSNEHFIVGVPKCDMFRLRFPEEEFYIQEDTKDVWIPEYEKFYNSNRYCVDELNGFTPLLCFTFTSNSSSNTLPVDQKIDTSNTVGMCSYICYIFVFKIHLIKNII